jgi:hypothetical protein
MASDSRRPTDRNIARALLGLLTIAFVLGVASPAHAVLITVNGIRQFYDDFENVSPGSSPDTAPHRGRWRIQGTTIPVTTNVMPGPAQGRQYLAYTRALPGEAAWWNDIEARLETEQALENLKIHAEWMMYVPSATPPTYRATVLFSDDTKNLRTGLLLGEDATGSVKYLRPGEKWQTAKSTYTPDTWQKWTMDYTVGQSKFTFSIGNGPRETVDSHTAGSVTLMSFAGNHKVGSTFYLDAVPTEPATTVLLQTLRPSNRHATPSGPTTKEHGAH